MADGMAGGLTAKALVSEALGEVPKPRLLIRGGDLPRTACELADLLAGTGRLFERGTPVRLALDKVSGAMVAKPLTPSGVVMEAHRVCQPYRVAPMKDGSMKELDATLPERLALLYLDMAGEWDLPPLHGIACGPLLAADGAIRAAEGYDARTAHWCAEVPDLAGLVPAAPTRKQAERALRTLRATFRTFPFANAPKVHDPTLGVPVVNTVQPAGLDETSFLAGLLTAVCRPSLDLAPGLLLRAPAMSGAGTGKGLLARCICTIAFGRAAQAFTGGADRKELELRLGAELMEAGPAVFLDNMNGIALKSDLLASVLTERPARVRVLGRSAMLPLNASAFIVITGNGLTVSEDLARRFLAVDLDAGMEDPEQRPFRGDLLASVRGRRGELLAACLTIWRWGRQNARTLSRGATLGSFGTWGEWVRDPLLALGCADPVARITEAKQQDRRRRDVANLFTTWHERYGSTPLPASDLHETVRAIADPQNHGRQYLTSRLDGLVGTRIAGLMLTRAKTAKWSVAKYAVERVDAGTSPSHPPMTPMTPHGFGTAGEGVSSSPRAPASSDLNRPAEGDYCSACLSGQTWWSERQDPAGWRCDACHPPSHLAPDQVETISTAE